MTKHERPGLELMQRREMNTYIAHAICRILVAHHPLERGGRDNESHDVELRFDKFVNVVWAGHRIGSG